MEKNYGRKSIIWREYLVRIGARDCAVDWGIALQAGRSRGRFPLGITELYCGVKAVGVYGDSLSNFMRRFSFPGTLRLPEPYVSVQG